MTLSAHPYADAWPMLSDDDLAELADDITANGLRAGRDTHPALFDLAPLVAPDHTHSIQDRFAAFHAANPWVADALERLAADWLNTGHERVGVKQLWEVVRWTYGQTTGDTFKANNNYTSRYARLLIERRPEWADAIETRELRAA